MLARSTVPSLIVIGTLHMLTLACACDAAVAANSTASESTAASRATFPIAAGNTHAPALNPSRWRPARRTGAYRPRSDFGGSAEREITPVAAVREELPSVLT